MALHRAMALLVAAATLLSAGCVADNLRGTRAAGPAPTTGGQAAQQALATAAPPTLLTRASSWYLQADQVAANTKLIEDHGDAVTGVYVCCGEAWVNADGSFFQPHTDKLLQGYVAPFVERSLDTLVVLGISPTAVMDGTAVLVLPDAIACALRNGFDGYMVDYEPLKNTTKSHAEAYAQFLSLAADALHAQGLALGFDLSSWGILDNFQTFADTGADVVMTMATYYGHDTTGDRNIVNDMITDGIDVSTLSVGIGTMVTKGAEWNYEWTQAKLHTFLAWVGSRGITQLGVWRADIDKYTTTEPWVFTELATFLTGGAAAAANVTATSTSTTSTTTTTIPEQRPAPIVLQRLGE